MPSWFTLKKKPLSSKSPNNKSRNTKPNTFATANPLGNFNTLKPHFDLLFEAERKKNISKYNKALAPLRNYRRANPEKIEPIVNQMLNRSRSPSNLSSFSNDDLTAFRNMIYERTNYDGGARRTRKQTRRSRRR